MWTDSSDQSELQSELQDSPGYIFFLKKKSMVLENQVHWIEDVIFVQL